MARNSATFVLIPVGQTGGKLDNDAPDYVFTPGTYLTLALAYDSLAAPTVRADAQGVLQPGYKAMQPRLALGWEEQENGDWIVRLRPGVPSHAGNEFTADDLAWTLDRATAQGVMGCWRWREVVGVERIDVIDRHTFALLPARALSDLSQLAAFGLAQRAGLGCGEGGCNCRRSLGDRLVKWPCRRFRRL